MKSFKENVNLYVDRASKDTGISADLVEHIKSTHSLLKVNVGVNIDGVLKISQVGELFIPNIFFQPKEAFGTHPM